MYHLQITLWKSPASIFNRLIKYKFIIALTGLMVILFFGVFIVHYHTWEPLHFSITLEQQGFEEEAQIYYRNIAGFNERQSFRKKYKKLTSISLTIPPVWVRGVRIDPSFRTDTVKLLSIQVINKDSVITWSGKQITKDFEISGVAEVSWDERSSAIWLIADATKDVQLILNQQSLKEISKVDHVKRKAYLIHLMLLWSIVLLLVVAAYRFKILKPLGKRLSSPFTIRNWNDKRTMFKVLVLFFISTPIWLYYYYSIQHAFNIPFWDEYDAALGLLNTWDSLSVGDRLRSLFRLHNEHRIFSYHTLVALQYEIFGKVNFTHLLIFSNLFLLPILWILYKLCDGYLKHPAAFIPVVFFLFVPMHEISNWGIMNMNGINLYLVVFASLYLLGKSSFASFTASIALALLATFSYGSGMFVFPVGLLVLYLNKRVESKKIWIWIGIGIVAVMIYFLGYQSADHHPSPFDAFKQPFHAFLFFILFFSNPFSLLLLKKTILMLIAGGIVLGTFSYLLWYSRSQLEKHRLLLAYLCFFVLCAAAATVSRFTLGIHAALAPRYILMPVLFIIIMYIWLLRLKIIDQPRHIFVFIFLSIILFMIRLNDAQSKMNRHSRQLKEGLISWHMEPEQSRLAYPNRHKAAMLFSKTQKNGLYQPPEIKELYPDIKLLNAVLTTPEDHHLEIHMDEIFHESSVLHFTGSVLPVDETAYHCPAVVVFYSPDASYLFSTQPIERPDIFYLQNDKNAPIYSNQGFFFILDLNSYRLNTGLYELGVGLLKENGEIVWTKWGYEVILE